MSVIVTVLRAIAAIVILMLLFRGVSYYVTIINESVSLDPFHFTAPVHAAPVHAPMHAAPIHAAPIHTAPIHTAPVHVRAPVHTAAAGPVDEATGYANEVSTLVFGITPPDRDAAARAANHRGPLIRDTIGDTIPTRIHGNSNSPFGLMARMVPSYSVTTQVISTQSVPFGSSTHFEDARVAQMIDADDAAKRRPEVYSSL